MTVTRLDHKEFDWETGAGGADEIRRVVETSEKADASAPLNEAALLVLRNRGLQTGVMLAGRLDADRGAGRSGSRGGSTAIAGRVDGFAFAHGLSGSGRPEVELVVHPEARGAGLGHELAVAVLDALDGIPLTAWSHGNHPAAAVLASRIGFAAARELWLMRRPSPGPLPKTETPAGVTIRPFRPGQDDKGLLEVNAAAFADHPEQGELDQRGLDDRIAESWFDPDGFLVAERDGQLLGFHWTKAEAGRGEVYVLGIDPRQQGTGLGKALLDAGLAHLQDQVGEIVLYVEGDNHGAIGLYESRGFTHAASDTDVMYAGPA